MNVIKPPFGPIESVTARRSVMERRRPPHVDHRPAVESAMSMEGLRLLQTQTEQARAARIELLKEQIKSGTYRPNFDVVAERLLAGLGVSNG